MGRACGGEEGPGEILRVVEPRKDTWSRRPAEEVQFSTYFQLVGVQLHLLYFLLVVVDLPCNLYVDGAPLAWLSYWRPIRISHPWRLLQQGMVHCPRSTRYVNWI